MLDLERADVQRVSLINLLVTAGMLLAFRGPVAQAATAQAPADESDLKLRVDTTLVLVPVTVTDSLNRFVLGLEKQDFRVYEDGKEQQVKQLSGEDAPLSVGLLVDLSGSMGSKIETSRRAVAQFLRTMNAQDEAFLIEFSDRASLMVPLTRDLDEIEKKLSGVESGGMTALLDAVYMGLHEMKRAKNPRKALLLVSDGGDNNSRYTPSEIEDLVREADVQIYSMGVFDPLPSFALSAAELSGPRLLSEISQQTGGRVYGASRFADLPSIAKKIGIELRNKYVLAYSPANPARDGKFRHVDVKLKQPQDLPTLKARWRLGYYAPAQ